jgi:hypothetical protein
VLEYLAGLHHATSHPARDDVIVQAIENCRALLLGREITVAGECRKLILPVRIENAQPKRGLRMRLSDLNWIDAFPKREKAVNEIVERFGPVSGPSACAQASCGMAPGRCGRN